MSPAIERAQVTAVEVAVPTRFELLAGWRVLAGSGARVRRTGVGAVRPPRGFGAAVEPALAVIGIGLCGALSTNLTPGTVVVPGEVGTTGGRSFECAPDLVHLLVAAAARLGHTAHVVRLLTSSTVVAGGERARWAARGYSAVDMETGRLLERGGRVAAVRVVLDTPAAELPAGLGRNHQVLLRPRSWIPTMALAAPAWRYASLSAAVAAEALRSGYSA